MPGQCRARDVTCIELPQVPPDMRTQASQHMPTCSLQLLPSYASRGSHGTSNPASEGCTTSYTAFRARPCPARDTVCSTGGSVGWVAAAVLQGVRQPARLRSDPHQPAAHAQLARCSLSHTGLLQVWHSLLCACANGGHGPRPLTGRLLTRATRVTTASSSISSGSLPGWEAIRLRGKQSSTWSSVARPAASMFLRQVGGGSTSTGAPSSSRLCAHCQPCQRRGPLMAHMAGTNTDTPLTPSAWE